MNVDGCSIGLLGEPWGRLMSSSGCFPADGDNDDDKKTAKLVVRLWCLNKIHCGVNKMKLDVYKQVISISKAFEVAKDFFEIATRSLIVSSRSVA